MTKTKISPDGSLPRITSSSIGITRHLQIVKVPDDEVKEGGLLYKLIHITANESESESEKSEEEPWSDDDIPNVQLSVENMPNNQLSLETKEKAKDVESQTEARAQRGKPERIKRRYRNNRNKRFRRSPKKGNFNSSKRNFNTSNRPHKKYDKSNTSLSNVEENNYNYFSNNTEFGSSSNFGRKFNPPRNSELIDIWINPPDALINIGPPFPCPTFSYGPASVIEQTPPNNNADNSLKKSVGLLGDYPHSGLRPHNFPSNRQDDDPPYSAPHPRDFPSNRQNDDSPYSASHPRDFPSNRLNDDPPYSASHPRDFPANRQNDDFIGKQEYWNNIEYQDYSPNNYQRRPNHGRRGRGRGLMSVPSGYKNPYQRNHWQSRVSKKKDLLVNAPKFQTPSHQWLSG